MAMTDSSPNATFALACELISRPSVTPEDSGCLDLIAARLAPLGFRFERIDTGGVEVHPAPVRLRELFARLRLHFEPIAFEKGLMLSFRGERHVALL